MADSPAPKIPSIVQLMELRPLKDLAQRISTSTVLAGVRSYLEPYQRRALEAAPPLPFSSLQHLAHEISDWILGQQGLLRPEVINATGQVLGSRFPSTPLADEVVVQAHARRHDYRLAERETDFRQATQKLVCQLTGAEAVLVLKDRRASLYAAGLALAAQGGAVPRAQMSTTFDGIQLPRLLPEAGGLQEVGASNRVDFQELTETLGGQSRVMLWLDRTNFDAPGVASFPATHEGLATLTAAEVTLWVDLGIAGLVPDRLHEQFALTSARQALEQGAEVALVGSGMLFGGPSCGLILGRKEAIARIRRQPIVAQLEADSVAYAELEATLRIYQSQERLEDRLPVVSLLTTPLENLDLRATRLADQLAASAWVESATTQLATGKPLAGGILLDTRQVVIQWSAEATENWGAVESRLATFPSIECLQINPQQATIDMRTLFPRQDGPLAARFFPESNTFEGVAAESNEK